MLAAGGVPLLEPGVVHETPELRIVSVGVAAANVFVVARGGSWLPYALVTLFFGAAGPLLYLIRRPEPAAA